MTGRKSFVKLGGRDAQRPSMFYRRRKRGKTTPASLKYHR
jgi:hypothetical protein